MTSAPADPGRVLGVPRLGPLGLLRWAWRSLTSMCTALVRGLAVSRPPWGNMYEFSVTFALMVIAGAAWAEAAWGRYWGWDSKETWAFITWVAYAAYLHAHATAGWKGRRATAIGLIAFAAFVFNYYGVNTFRTGLHSYAGV